MCEEPATAGEHRWEGLGTAVVGTLLAAPPRITRCYLYELAKQQKEMLPTQSSLKTKPAYVLSEFDKLQKISRSVEQLQSFLQSKAALWQSITPAARTPSAVLSKLKEVTLKVEQLQSSLQTRAVISSSDPVYTGAVYCIPKDDHCRVIFVIGKDLMALREYMTKHYTNAEECMTIPGLQFVRPYLELDLTAPVPAGWKITPHHEPMKLYQCDIDKFHSLELPRASLSVYPVNDVPNPDIQLEYKIPLLGVVQQPNNSEVSITIVRSGGFPVIQNKYAEMVLTENMTKLTEVISVCESFVLRDIITACEAKELVTSSEAAYILDTMKEKFAHYGARQLIRYIQTLVEYCGPDKLDVFLSILQERGNTPVKAVAEDIATKYHYLVESSSRFNKMN